MAGDADPSPRAWATRGAGSGPTLVGSGRRGRALRSGASVGGVGPSARGVRARRLGCSRRLGRSGALRAQSLRSLRARRRPPSSPPRLPPLACSPPRSAALPPPPSAPSLAALPPRPSASLVAGRHRHQMEPTSMAADRHTPPYTDTDNPRRISLTRRG